MCVPLFVLLTIGAIQTTDAIYLKNSLRVVAYETARRAIEPGSTNAAADAKANEILAARNVQGGTVTYNPSDVSTAASGSPVTVTVSASADANTIMPNWFYTGRTITAQLTMSKE